MGVTERTHRAYSYFPAGTRCDSRAKQDSRAPWVRAAAGSAPSPSPHSQPREDDEAGGRLGDNGRGDGAKCCLSQKLERAACRDKVERRRPGQPCEAGGRALTFHAGYFHAQIVFAHRGTGADGLPG